MMRFSLLSSDHLNGFRRFAFQSIRDDHSRSTVVVSVDLTLARKYAIQLQELPLLAGNS
jgi:hypothetical protein